MILDRQLRYVYVNDAYLHATQQTDMSLIGKYVFDVFPDTPERTATVKKAFETALGGSVSVLDAQPFQLVQNDGSVRDVVWQAIHDPIYDEAGHVTHVIQRAEDITAQHKLEARNRAITYELNHRVKNIMSVVLAIARISGRKAKDLSSFMDSFTKRIEAMSRANDRLAHDNWQGLTVEDTLQVELSPYGLRTGVKYTLSGPTVKLSTDGAKDLSMVVHELLTNAIKYGCFSPRGGELHVSWYDVDDGLKVEWIETCDAKIDEPKGDGFGSRLFSLLPNVSIERDFRPKGVKLSVHIAAGEAFA